MLLELNPTGAREVGVRYCDENGLGRTFEEVIQPALDLTREERAGKSISEENERLILDTTHALIGELAARFVKQRIAPSGRALGVMAPTDANFLSLLMLLALLRKDGVGASFSSRHKSPAEVCDLATRFTPDSGFLPCVDSDCNPAALEPVNAL